MPWIPCWAQEMALRVDWEDSVRPGGICISQSFASLYCKIGCERHYRGRLIYKLKYNWLVLPASSPGMGSPSMIPKPWPTWASGSWVVGYHQGQGTKCILCDALQTLRLLLTQTFRSKVRSEERSRSLFWIKEEEFLRAGTRWSVLKPRLEEQRIRHGG